MLYLRPPCNTCGCRRLSRGARGSQTIQIVIEQAGPLHGWQIMTLRTLLPEGGRIRAYEFAGAGQQIVQRELAGDVAPLVLQVLRARLEAGQPQVPSWSTVPIEPLENGPAEYCYGFFLDCETTDAANVFVVALDVWLCSAAEALVSIALLVTFDVPACANALPARLL